VSNDGIAFSTFADPPEAMAAAVEQGLDDHNAVVAPIDGVRPLAVFATGSASEVVGGAIGRTWGGCCELKRLWVKKASRGSGIGSELVRRFEQEGRTRGCNVFYLTTLSYQAPGFYRSLGYEQFAEVSGYPNGIKKYLMQKKEA
jgi:ribosomal protein S18 acetylase RimI-like enzyme